MLLGLVSWVISAGRGGRVGRVSRISTVSRIGKLGRVRGDSRVSS